MPLTRRQRVLGIALILVVATAVATPLVVRPALSQWTWARLSAHLERLFDADLTVESFDVSVFPAVTVSGRGLRLTRGDRPSDPPLLTIDSFATSTNLFRLWNGNIRSVTLDGVALVIPSDRRPSLRSAQATEPDYVPAEPRRLPPLTVDEIAATNTRLEIAPKDPAGVPLVFLIHLARLAEFSTTAPARFEARLLNPKPRGEIAAQGRIGPWQTADPRTTSVQGDYTLSKADMSVFKGIGGLLDSTGKFDGTLDAIAVSGIAELPDFSVETGGHPMPLTTSFVARVDGTNGNTYLDRVSARLGDSSFEAVGEIAGTPGADGKAVRLHVTTDSARLDDFIRLVVPGEPAPMRGQLALDARMTLPPGDAPVVEALELDGHFTIRQGQFASDAVQDKVDELSRRGRGQPKNESIDNVLSTFGGRFTLRRGLLGLPGFQFAVRGAEVRLAGSYALRGERLSFAGELRLQARVSQTTTGFKSLLLKLIDPFFSKHGAGAVLPIRVGGTVAEPEFGLSLFGRSKPGD